jgi:transposase
MKSATTLTELDLAEVERAVELVEQHLGEDVARPLRLLLMWSGSLLALLQEKNLSLKRLRRLLFGPRTERTCDVVAETNANELAAGEEPPGEPPQSASPSAGRGGRPRRRPRGHGRIPASAYTGCERVIVTHEAFSPGDSCPDCQDGTLYRMKEWVMRIRLVGQAPVGGKRYELERLRCGTCGKTHVAEPPEDMGPDKYDASVASTVATLRYGEGLPWTRIERLQKAAGIPLATSVQWELCRDALARGPLAAYQQLLWEAAQGDLLHNDDTHMRVLEWAAKAKRGEPLREDAPGRSGVFTTSILSVSPQRPTIALFFTGVAHAGENLHGVLQQRMEVLAPPVQMCDALARNLPKDLETIVAHCLSHARRNFVDLAEVFPQEVQHVLLCLKEVYRTDAAAKRFKLSDELRLQLHQRRSAPLMNELHGWLTEQLEQRNVEPNSSLGQAIKYLLNHWEPLTLFLRRPGVPLDNNLCERALKMAIRHRKNSLFYKTQHGADVGDVYMSLIHTCYFAGVDPRDYLTQVQRHEQQVQAEPAHWLPWNYRQQLARE